MLLFQELWLGIALLCAAFPLSHFIFPWNLPLAFIGGSFVTSYIMQKLGRTAE